MSERFLGYAREELDRQYDLIGRHGDAVDAHYQAYEIFSRDAYCRLPQAGPDVACGDGLVMNLFPASEPGAPIVLFLHGGMSKSRSRRDCATAVDNARRAALFSQSCGPAGRRHGPDSRTVASGRLDAEAATACFLAVDEHETDEYHRQMMAYGMAAEAAGCAVNAATEADHNHFSLLGDLADPSSVFTKQLIRSLQPHADGKATLYKGGVDGAVGPT